MRVVVIGPKGKMGKLISQVVWERKDMELLAGVGPAGRDYIGADMGQVAALGTMTGALVVDDLAKVMDDCDVIIDYSTVEMSLAVLKAARQHRKAVVCGTTGFSEEHWAYMREVSKDIPFLYGANTSRVVNLLYEILEMTAARLGNQADIEIIEMHDRYKKDAPSGTSKELGHAVAKGLGQLWDELAVFGRSGPGERKPGSIGYHSVRAGDISSSHTVMFGFQGERLEITHHAHNWLCFAQGACDAARYLWGRPPGYYTVQDMLKGSGKDE